MIDHQRNNNAVYRLGDGMLPIATGLIGGAFNLNKSVESTVGAYCT